MTKYYIWSCEYNNNTGFTYDSEFIYRYRHNYTGSENLGITIPTEVHPYGSSST